MNVLDTSIMVTMIFFIIRGIFRGFFRETGSLAGVVLGIWFANVYQTRVTFYLKEYLPSVSFISLISFGVIFTVVFAVCNLAGWVLKAAVRKVFFGWADRSLGAGLAVVKGVVLTYLVIVLLTVFVPSRAPLITESRLAPVIITSYQAMASLVSPGAYERLKKTFGSHTKVMERLVPKEKESVPRSNG